MSNEKVAELTGAKKMVKDILEAYPKTRSNDILLYVRYAKKKGATSLEDLVTLDIKPGTVTRTRRFIQKSYPGLKADDTVQEKRKEHSRAVSEAVSTNQI